MSDNSEGFKHRSFTVNQMETKCYPDCPACLTEKHAKEIKYLNDFKECYKREIETLAQRVESAESIIEKLTKCDSKWCGKTHPDYPEQGKQPDCQRCRNRKKIEGSNE